MGCCEMWGKFWFLPVIGQESLGNLHRTLARWPDGSRRSLQARDDSRDFLKKLRIRFFFLNKPSGKLT